MAEQRGMIYRVVDARNYVAPGADRPASLGSLGTEPKLSLVT